VAADTFSFGVQVARIVERGLPDHEHPALSRLYVRKAMHLHIG
jgi:hypothetical protein